MPLPSIPPPLLGIYFSALMYFCIQVKHCNLPYDAKIHECGGGLHVGGYKRVASTMGERLERKPFLHKQIIYYIILYIYKSNI